MKVKIELNQEEIEEAVRQYVAKDLGMEALVDVTLFIEVKSKQNYKSEWEQAAYRGILCK